MVGRDLLVCRISHRLVSSCPHVVKISAVAGSGPGHGVLACWPVKRSPPPDTRIDFTDCSDPSAHLQSVTGGGGGGGGNCDLVIIDNHNYMYLYFIFRPFTLNKSSSNYHRKNQEKIFNVFYLKFLSLISTL